MKMSRRERKAFNEGKAAGYTIGYLEGYKKGLYDGNPFNALRDAVNNSVKVIREWLDNPEVQKLIEEQKKLQDMDSLEIESGDES